MGSSTTTLEFLITAVDKASDTFGKVSDSVEKTKAGIDKFGALAGAALTAASAAAVAFGKESLGAFTDVAKQSVGLQRVIGGTVEDASRLRYAFSQVGMSADDVMPALKIMEKGVEGNSKGWQSLGISALDSSGKMRPMASLLPEIAAKFAEMPNGTEKTALALQLFGRSGTDMIPILNKGSQGMKDLMAASDAMGQTVSGSGAKAMADGVKAQREFDAALAGVKVTIGQAMMPAIADMQKFFSEKLVPVIQSATKFISEHGREFGIVAAIITAVVGPLGIFIGIVKTATAVTGAWTAAQLLLDAAMDANPIGLVVLAIVALVAGFLFLWDNCKEFRDFFIGMWNGIKGAVSATGQFFADTWAKIVAGIQGLGTKIAEIWNGVINFFKGLGAKIMGALAFFAEIPGKVGEWLAAMLVKAKEVLGSIGQWFTDRWNEVAKATEDAWGSIVEWIKGVPDLIVSALSGLRELRDRALAWFAGVGDAAMEKLSQAVSWIQGVPDRIMNALGDLGRLLYSAGQAALNGFWDGMKDTWSQVQDWVSGIAGWIGENKGPVDADYRLLQPAGNAIMAGLDDAMQARFAGVKATIAGATSAIGSMGANAVVRIGGQPAPVSMAGIGGGGLNVTIHVAGSVVQERDLAISVRDQLAQLMRRRGMDPSILGV